MNFIHKRTDQLQPGDRIPARVDSQDTFAVIKSAQPNGELPREWTVEFEDGSLDDVGISASTLWNVFSGYIEEGEYRVELRASVVLTFSPVKRSSRLSAADAIDNARATVPEKVWQALEDEGWSLDFSAESI